EVQRENEAKQIRERGKRRKRGRERESVCVYRRGRRGGFRHDCVFLGLAMKLSSHGHVSECRR
ncbi:hypothetical protein PDJAM_G00247600, partial [Pangasius djambal]|nr:hypothetical protein [Pangasius djambal]